MLWSNSEKNDKLLLTYINLFLFYSSINSSICQNMAIEQPNPRCCSADANRWLGRHATDFPPKADETAAPSAEQNAPSGLDEDYNDHQAAYGSKVNSKAAAGGVGDAADLSRIEQELLGTEL